MRKLIAIFFVILFTVSFTETGQLLKLPFLVQHYIAHLGSGRSDSLSDFLIQHYLPGHENDGDEKQDEQLPFKTLSLNNVGSSFLLTPVYDLALPVVTIGERVNLYHAGYIPSHKLFGIFHPPRTV
jgi:hypothetical protein